MMKVVLVAVMRMMALMPSTDDTTAHGKNFSTHGFFPYKFLRHVIKKYTLSCFFIKCTFFFVEQYVIAYMLFSMYLIEE